MYKGALMAGLLEGGRDIEEAEGLAAYRCVIKVFYRGMYQADFHDEFLPLNFSITM
jgi:hypothetical protein